MSPPGCGSRAAGCPVSAPSPSTLARPGRESLHQRPRPALAAAGGGGRTRIGELANPAGARPAAAEIVGLVPEAALEGFPDDVAIPGFDRGAPLPIERVAG